MSNIAIRVEQVSKRYRIGPGREPGRSARRLLLPQRGTRRLQRDAAGSRDEVWALKNVSFELSQGEVLGIIGRNGSGKSTLLKILSRVTSPTEGHVELRGRVGSLLEVGTGFHPELTGRENVFLNGAILGMKKSEIRGRFDEIVEFSEIGRFIDTPVKHYSSGMYVRLAFAVAAHFDSEILLVDEVLAVGDAAFQQKCLGRIGATARAGRTVLLVSHNVLAIESLCPTALLLREGRVAFLGATPQGLKDYLDTGTSSGAGVRADLAEHPGRRLGSDVVIRSIEVIGGGQSSLPESGAPLEIQLSLDPGAQRYEDCAVGIGILSAAGQLLAPFKTRTQYAGTWALSGPTRVSAHWHRCCLTPGVYHLRVAFASRDQGVDWVDDALVMEVNAPYRRGAGNDYSGVIVPEAEWAIDPAEGRGT
jgi:lipopolysaccharide transport system ATP-binding protein